MTHFLDFYTHINDFKEDYKGLRSTLTLEISTNSQLSQIAVLGLLSLERSHMSKTNAPLTHKEIMVVLSGLMTGMLLAALDQTIVSTALKRIVEDFNGLNHYTWVVTAYILTSTASTPLYGKVSDLYGRRPVYQFAIITFLIGSLLAGASQNMSQLIATRALQGLGAGGLMALTFVIIGDIVAPRDRGKYQGYFGAVWGLSSVAEIGRAHV